MVVYMRHILYIYSHFPCLKVFFKGRCSFLLLFFEPFEVRGWRGFCHRGLGIRMWYSPDGLFLETNLSWFLLMIYHDFLWFTMIYHDFSWWKIHVFLWKNCNPCFLMKQLQFLNTLEGRFFGFFCWRMFCTVKTPCGVEWCKERRQLAAVSYDRRPIKFSTEVLIYIYIYIYEWYIYTNLHIYTCGDIIWCE